MLPRRIRRDKNDVAGKSGRRPRRRRHSTAGLRSHGTKGAARDHKNGNPRVWFFRRIPDHTCGAHAPAIFVLGVAYRVWCPRNLPIVPALPRVYADRSDSVSAAAGLNVCLSARTISKIRARLVELLEPGRDDVCRSVSTRHLILLPLSGAHDVRLINPFTSKTDISVLQFLIKDRSYHKSHVFAIRLSSQLNERESNVRFIFTKDPDGFARRYVKLKHSNFSQTQRDTAVPRANDRENISRLSSDNISTAPSELNVISAARHWSPALLRPIAGKGASITHLLHLPRPIFIASSYT